MGRPRSASSRPRTAEPQAQADLAAEPTARPHLDRPGPAHRPGRCCQAPSPPSPTAIEARLLGRRYRDKLGVLSRGSLDFGNCWAAAHRASLLQEIEDQQIAHLVARPADEMVGGRRGTTIADPLHAPPPVRVIAAGVVVEHLQPKPGPGSAAISSLSAKIGNLLPVFLAVDERPDASASSPPRTTGSFKRLVLLQQGIVNGAAPFPPSHRDLPGGCYLCRREHNPKLKVSTPFPSQPRARQVP